MVIYAGSISNLTDARYFAAWNIQWMGYNFDPGSDQPLSKEAFNAIAAWVEGPERVLEAGMDDLSHLGQMCMENHCGILKLHPFQSLDGLEYLREAPLKIVNHYVFENTELNAALMDFIDSEYVLFDFHKNGIDPRTVDGFYSLLKKFKESGVKSFIAWPLNIQFDKEWIDSAHLFGLYLTGGPEEKIGVKSFEVLDEILELYSGF